MACCHWSIDFYFDLRPLEEGKIRYIAVSKDEGSGNP